MTSRRIKGGRSTDGLIASPNSCGFIALIQDVEVMPRRLIGAIEMSL